MNWDLTAYLGILALGIAIAAQGVRAYRRTGDGVMILVAVGIFTIASHGIVEFIVRHVLMYSDDLADLADVVLVGFGMVCIFVALFAPASLVRTRGDR